MTTPATKDEHALNISFLYSIMIALGVVALAAALVFIRGENRTYLWMLMIIEAALVLGLTGYVQQQRRSRREKERRRI